MQDVKNITHVSCVNLNTNFLMIFGGELFIHCSLVHFTVGKNLLYGTFFTVLYSNNQFVAVQLFGAAVLLPKFSRTIELLC